MTQQEREQEVARIKKLVHETSAELRQLNEEQERIYENYFQFLKGLNGVKQEENNS